MQKPTIEKILILGSSGWIAHYLIQDLLEQDCAVIGLSKNKSPLHKIENHCLDIEDAGFLKLVKQLDCACVINMLHSKNFDLSFERHKEIADYCKIAGKRYVYCSSSNAVDGDPSRPHHENEKANGGSDYGKHKARCEEYLYKNFPKACILRFPAAHGHAPNRVARTEEFLIKLKTQKSVSVPTGVYQNRPYVGHLSKMISQIILDGHQGVFHLGTEDEGEEFLFCALLAQAFGYDRNKLEVGEAYDFNMTVYPKRIYELYGERFRFTQKDTIDKLANCPRLAKYKKSP